MRGRGVLGRQALEGLSVSTDGDGGTGEWTMTATEFRARCYGLMDEVVETGPEIAIMKRRGITARFTLTRMLRFNRGTGLVHQEFRWTSVSNWLLIIFRERLGTYSS